MVFDLKRFKKNYLRCTQCPYNSKLDIGQDFCTHWKDMCVTLVELEACDLIKEAQMGCKGKKPIKK